MFKANSTPIKGTKAYLFVIYEDFDESEEETNINFKPIYMTPKPFGPNLRLEFTPSTTIENTNFNSTTGIEEDDYDFPDCANNSLYQSIIEESCPSDEDYCGDTELLMGDLTVSEFE